MRWSRWVPAVVMTCWPALLRAADPALAPSSAAVLSAAPEAAQPVVLPAPEPVSAPPDEGSRQLVNVMLLLGFPTGVRVQAAVDRQERRTIVVEGFVGQEPGWFESPLFLGVGGRVLYPLAKGTSCNRCQVSPGLNLVDMENDRHAHWYLVPNVEIGWLHDFESHFGWEIGLDLGAGPRLVRFDRVLPWVSAYTGLRF